MTYKEQGPNESDVAHMLRNAPGLGLTTAQVRELRRAYALEQGTKTEKRRAREIGAQVRRELMAASHAVVLTEARHDRALGKDLTGQGYEVTDEGRLRRAKPALPVREFNDAGALSLSSRDGFAALFEAGKITRAELEVGLLYRSVYEVQGRDLRSQLDDTNAGGGSDHERFVIARLHRAYDASLCHRFEQAVIEACTGPKTRRGLREIKVLRAVAGEGLALRALSSGGAMQAVNLACLVRALAACRPVVAIGWAA